MAALWGLLALDVLMFAVIVLLLLTVMHQGTEIRDGAHRIIALRMEQQGQTERFEDFRQEVYGYFLDGGDDELGDGVDREQNDYDRDTLDVDWEEFDPFADPPVRHAPALGSI